MGPKKLVGTPATSDGPGNRERGRTMSASTPAFDDVMSDDLEEASRFGRGILFGIAFSLPIWAAIIAMAQLIG